MDFDQPVFTPLAAFEKIAYANLSPNAQEWVHDITKIMYDKAPYVTQFSTRIKLDRVDEQKGYGYGTIKVGDTIDIPLIIKNFELQALDVFLHNGEFFPLSERRIEEILFNPEVFGKPTDASGAGDQSIYPSNYPPHSGKYTYASVLAQLDNKVTEADKKNFAVKVGGDRSIFASFKVTGNMKLVKQALELNAKVKRDVNSVLPPNVIQIEKIAEDAFVVRATSDLVYAPKEVLMNRADLLRKFGAEAASEALSKGIFTTVQGTRPWKPTMFENVEDGKASKITAQGRYEVRTIDGDRRIGWVFPNIVDFDLKKTGDKLFTDGEAYALQSDIIGLSVESAANPENGDEPSFSELEQGKTGVFCISRGSGSLCTIPVTIASPIFDQGTHIRAEVFDHFGTPFIIEITSGARSITKSKHQANVYTIPADARFMEIGRQVNRLQDSLKDFNVREQAMKISKAKDVVIVTCDDGNVFNIAGTNLKEIASDARGVGRTKAKWHLVTLGSSPSEADHILDRAQSDGTAKVIGTKPLITQAEKRAQVFKERVLPLLETMPQMKADLIKEASVIDDEQVVDKVLSLNFLTPDNVATFVEYLPAFEDSSSKLAKLLVAIRIGLNRIPEPAVKNAMQGLEVTIAGLRSMEALQNVGPLEGSV